MLFLFIHKLIHKEMKTKREILIMLTHRQSHNTHMRNIVCCPGQRNMKGIFLRLSANKDRIFHSMKKYIFHKLIKLLNHMRKHTI